MHSWSGDRRWRCSWPPRDGWTRPPRCCSPTPPTRRVEVDEEGREQAESDLTAALRAAFADAELVDDLRRDPVGGELVAELAASALRVQLARRFLNDVVRNARVVRRKRVVRYLRIAGHAPWPQTFEMSDTPPEALAGGSFTRDAYRRPT